MENVVVLTVVVYIDADATAATSSAGHAVVAANCTV